MSSGRVEQALRHLASAIEPGSAPVDALRLLALAARQLGDDGLAESVLVAAHQCACSAGDLVGAADALRRLDAMGVECGGIWARFLSDIAVLGFDEEPSRQEWLDAPPDESDRSPEEIARSLGDAANAAASHSPRARAFDPVPLLTALPIAELQEALRELQIRVVPDGEMLAAASAGAPAWVTSGSLAYAMHPASVRPGTLVLPDTETARAHGPVRLLTMPREWWHAASAVPGVDDAVEDLRRHAAFVRALRECAFFVDLTPGARDLFVSALTGVSTDAGTFFRRGDAVTGLFVLVEGDVDLVSEDGSVADRLRRGDVFGELDVLTGGGAAFDAIARGPAHAVYAPVDLVRALVGAETDARQALVGLTETRREAVVPAAAPA